jgi:hypothetical protein
MGDAGVKGKEEKVRVYARMKRHEKAIDDYSNAIGSDPRNGSSYVGRGSSYAAIGQEKNEPVDRGKACSLLSKMGCEGRETRKKGR